MISLIFFGIISSPGSTSQFSLGFLALAAASAAALAAASSLEISSSVNMVQQVPLQLFRVVFTFVNVVGLSALLMQMC